MGKQIEITRDYVKYRTLSILPEENKTEYEILMYPDPVHGKDVHVVLNISNQEARTGAEKELDFIVADEKKRILVKVPSGIESGKYIRYRQKGEPGEYGGKNGDLYVRVVVEPEETEGERKKEVEKENEKKSEKEPDLEKIPVNGLYVYAVLNISAKEAESGVEKELDVLVAGEQKRILVKVPAGIENGKYIRYRGKGEPGKYGGQNGDLYVRIAVEKEKNVEDSASKTQNSESKESENKHMQPLNSEEQVQSGKAEQSAPTQENTIPINITFLEAAKGTEKEIILPERTTCNKCKGTGIIKKKSCSACKGSGVVDDPHKIRMKIPAGIDEGQFLRLKGKNTANLNEKFEELFQEFFGKNTEREVSKSKLNQDWYIKIHIDKHPKFERNGYDIYSTEYLPFYIGSSRMMAVDTLDGKRYCNITRETKDGSQTCLENKGISNLNNPSVRGNHYVTWKKK